MNTPHQSSGNAGATSASIIDYGRVAASTGMDYQKAIYITAAFLAVNIFFLDWPMTGLGMIGTTVLAVLSWNYFKAFFDVQKDKKTSYAIWGMMGAHVFFALIYLVLYFTDWFDLVVGSGVELLFCMLSGNCNETSYSSEFIVIMTLLNIALYGSLIAYLIGGMRLILVRKKYPFPLKRIAIPAMLLIPVLFIHYLLIGLWGEPDSNFLGRLLLCTPYFMLLHHFFKVKKAADAAPMMEVESSRPSPPRYEEDDLV